MGLNQPIPRETTEEDIKPLEKAKEVKEEAEKATQEHQKMSETGE